MYIEQSKLTDNVVKNIPNENNGMGIENLGGAIYDMLKDFKEPLLFDAMIRDFDERYFKYGDEVMTYFPDEQHNPYIDKEGNEYFEYFKC